MSISAKTSKQLALEISAIVESYLPTQLERDAAHSRLLTKIEAVLDSQASEPAACSRQVTILLADIRGFTTLAETYSAVMIMDLLNRFFAVMTEVIVQFGGTIDKLMGDSIMVLFGAPVSADDDVERALACAVSMQQAMSVFNAQNLELGIPELYMGIGINSGEVMAGTIGSQFHREYTVIGDEVNLTSRIESHSLRGQVLIGASTYEAAKDYVLVGLPNKVQVKGKRQPVCLYELLGTTKPRSLTVPQREVRKSPRIEVNMPCYFQLVEGKTVNGQRCRAEVLDMSYNGLLFLSPIPLESFSEIKMQLSLELLGSDTTDVYARIIQCESSECGFRCSLEFTSIDMLGQQTIKRFVDNILYQS